MNTAEQLEAARRFPDNTCPASRHAQLLAESLLASKKPRWSIDDPNHCGESIAAVVTALYQARDRIAELDGLLDRVVRNRDMWKGQCERQAEQLTEQKRATSSQVEQKRNMQEQGEPAQPAQPECYHDDTERLGAIWTRCMQCGKKWADDEKPMQKAQQPLSDERANFEIELRKQCFQKPTPEAYDLAWSMWKARAQKGTT